MLIFGHRGIRKTTDIAAPYQNTLEAIIHAFDEGADGIEIDIRLSKDNRPFVIHDDDLSLHGLGRGLLSGLNSSELAAIKVGRKAHSIPRLEQILDKLQKDYPDKFLNLELKNGTSCEPVCELIKDHKFNYEKLNISSFDHDQLRSIKKLDDQLNISPLISQQMLETMSLAAILKSFQAYNLHSLNIEDVLLKELGPLDYPIHVWSSSEDPPQKVFLKTLLENNVACLITDYPAICRQLLSEL